MDVTLGFAGYLLTLGLLPFVLSRKRDPAVALTWSMAIVLLPYFGALLYVIFGNVHIERPLSRKRRHHRAHLATLGRPPGPRTRVDGWAGLTRLADSLGTYPCREGNRVDFYCEGTKAYAAMEEAIRGATDHVYAQFFIWQPDDVGRRFIALLAAKAAEGVRVRMLYDSFGSYNLTKRDVQPILDAGGRTDEFLPIRRWRRHIQLNLRNHRKILTVDGQVGFTGGLNIGKEYVHRGEFSYWRDTHLRLEGPAASDLERVFMEDWHFVTDEMLPRPALNRAADPAGQRRVQVIASGPDQRRNTMYEMYFAAMTRCTQRLWIMSPYFVPTAALLMALRTAASLGVDVRLMAPSAPDHYLTFWAAHHYWDDVLDSGVRIFRYKRGMMHSKVILVDGQWATVGTANLDVRSMGLNFEVNAVFDDPEVVAELEAQYLHDLADAEELDVERFRHRPRYQKAIENVCRLFAPVL